MAREPSYPKDAAVGGKRGTPADPPPPPETADEPPSSDASRPADSRRRKHLMAGAAIGIGSAAIVAALLYANRSRRGDRS
jgi:hypothetical protein